MTRRVSAMRDTVDRRRTRPELRHQCGAAAEAQCPLLPCLCCRAEASVPPQTSPTRRKSSDEECQEMNMLLARHVLGRSTSNRYMACELPHLLPPRDPPMNLLAVLDAPPTD